MKRLFTLLLAIVLLSLSACTGNAPVESATIPETVPGTHVESATIPEIVPEVTRDPFLIEDDIVDSTQDIVIDFAAFVEERNAVHRASVEGKFTNEFIKTNGPDFYEDLDIVSEEEAAQLLHTSPADLLTRCAKEDALADVDLLFRVLKDFYGPYYFFGGDEVFGAAKEQIVQELSRGPDKLTLEELVSVLSPNLSFIKDRHMNIGPELLCETNKIAVHDYYVKDLWFYEDDVGYYTKKQDKKWYLTAVGSDENVSGYLKLTIDEKGQLCYMPGLTVPVDDPRRDIKEITLCRGERTALMPIAWTEFSRRKDYSLEETITVKDGIPLLETVPRPLRNYSGEAEEFQQNRLRNMGKDILTQDVMILNLNSGCGWQSLFESIDHQILELTMFKLSKTAERLGRWNMPWQEGNYGEYVTRYFRGKWGENDTLVFAVQDQNNFSAAESTISDILSIENVVLVGGSTGGTAGPSAATNQQMVLPKTGLPVHFGASLSINPGYTEDGYCFDPDIWIDPDCAVDAIYRMCRFYGISNDADTAVLDKYISAAG